MKEDGWCQGARHVPSPHFNVRMTGLVDMVVIHCISLPPRHYLTPFVEQFFLGTLNESAHPYFVEIKDLRVSSHFFIRRNGEVVQFVSTLDRAWHAGESTYLGHPDCNSRSVGIELEGTDDAPFESVQYDALVALTKAIMRRYEMVVPERIVGHSDIAPGRKTDPGPFFDWPYYLRQICRK
ncbi:MAG: 1,6-anhydro-N-acetylmuramyl-L-alanine amidase AmpD [Gammaproteobacteria bacterium]|nr:MAG: 1,6-anhydro-N-acetylmuramyl-L-alanine amidase AmpD [Gammaproteobacteria bacterium]